MNRFFSALGAFIMETLTTVAVVVSIFFIVYMLFMQPHQVSGLSMYPTYHNGDYVLTDKVTYKTRLPRRGEVVVFTAPEAAECPKGTGCDFIKRIVGVPGDTVEIKQNAIWINNRKLSEPYIPAENYTEPGKFTENRQVNLGPDEFFVSGDNRPHSSDSRTWGPLTSKDIVGRVFFRYWPINAAGTTPEVKYPL